MKCRGYGPRPEKAASRSSENSRPSFQSALLLKGSRTLVGQFGKPMAYNSTGSPGLATGGSGDVLTGVCAAFLARKIPAYDAGRLGAWLCGRAAELAVSLSSEESMLPSDLFYLGSALGLRAFRSGPMRNRLSSASED